MVSRWTPSKQLTVYAYLKWEHKATNSNNRAYIGMWVWWSLKARSMKRSWSTGQGIQLQEAPGERYSQLLPTRLTSWLLCIFNVIAVWSTAFYTLLLTQILHLVKPAAIIQPLHKCQAPAQRLTSWFVWHDNLQNIIDLILNAQAKTKNPK